MISWRDYRRSSTDRIAAALIEVTKSYAPRNEGGLASRKRAGYIQQYAVRLARQVAFQGLSPDDIDRANGDPSNLFQAKGVDVLDAIAAAIFVRGNREIDGVVGPMEQALKSRLPVEWRHVVDAVARLLDRAVAARFFDF